MFALEKLAVMAYTLCILSGVYLGISTLKNMYLEMHRMEVLASINLDDDAHKVLVFDAVEPAAGTD